MNGSFINIENPEVADDMSGEELGITELVRAQSTYFYGSSPSRVQNIKASAARFHGLVIAPGETFSMSDALGDVSLDEGYAELPEYRHGVRILDAFGDSLYAKALCDAPKVLDLVLYFDVAVKSLHQTAVNLDELHRNLLQNLFGVPSNAEMVDGKLKSQLLQFASQDL